jgi:predicted RNA-binding Zn-ribbon protein involved in translation (DUF1610 family)
VHKANEAEEEPGPSHFEKRPCPSCGGMMSILRLDHRFIGNYTCPHCGGQVLLLDNEDA